MSLDTLLVASVASVTVVPAYIGATGLWHRLVDFHDAHTDRPSPWPIVPASDAPTLILRRPVAAIAAEPEYEVDQLGPWKPWEHEIQPAVIWREMTEVPR